MENKKKKTLNKSHSTLELNRRYYEIQKIHPVR